MTETELQNSIIELCKWKGYLHYHTHDSRKSEEGFPDLNLAHEETGRLIYVECKSEDGVVSAGQIKWGLALVKSDAEYYLWRPHDWLDGTIQNVLESPKKQKQIGEIK